MNKTVFLGYLELTKPKVTLLNLLVGVTCFVLAAYPSVDFVRLAVFSLVGYLAAGGCGVLNSVYDQDIDRRMIRTAKRAIPTGTVSSNKALIYGSAMITGSFLLSYFCFDVLTLAMVVLGAVFYLLVYTVWLKRRSALNVVIGGVAGCFAALSGWTAVTNSLSLLPLLVASLDFLWTPGHLWGLALKKGEEYRKAKVPMLPVNFGRNTTAKIIFWLNIGTVLFSFSFPLLNLSGTMFTVIAVIGGAGFLLQNLWLLVYPSEAVGFKVFLASMPYLACIMFGLIIDKVLLI
jgi:heme o synthase